MKTLEKDETQNSDNIVKQFLYPKNVSTKAMEMGYKWDVNLHIRPCGMFVSNNAILGVSPDGLISCNLMESEFCKSNVQQNIGMKIQS